MNSLRVRWVLAIAGLVWLLPVPAARAQFSLGYDSLIYGPQSQSYYAGMGYTSIYTDPSTGDFANGMNAPVRTVTPYQPPSFSSVGPANRLNYYYGQPTTVTRAPTRRLVVQKRRGLFGRVRPGAEAVAQQVRRVKELGQQAVDPLRFLVLDPVGRPFDEFQAALVATGERVVRELAKDEGVLRSPDDERGNMDARADRLGALRPHGGAVPVDRGGQRRRAVPRHFGSARGPLRRMSPAGSSASTCRPVPCRGSSRARSRRARGAGTRRRTSSARAGWDASSALGE